MHKKGNQFWSEHDVTFALSSSPAGSSHLKSERGHVDVVTRLPQQILIMGHHHVPVFGQVNVELQHLGALLHGTGDGHVVIEELHVIIVYVELFQTLRAFFIPSTITHWW